MELTKIEIDTINNIGNLVHRNKLSNECLVQLIELLGSYVNICTIPKYAKKHRLTYNGVKKTRHIVKIFDVKFVIDND